MVSASVYVPWCMCGSQSSTLGASPCPPSSDRVSLKFAGIHAMLSGPGASRDVSTFVLTVWILGFQMQIWQTWPHCYIFPVFTEKSLKLIKPILPPLCFWVFFQAFCNFAFGREVCEALWINFEDSVRPQNYVFAYWLIACGCASVLALPDAKAAPLVALSWPLCQQPAGYVCMGMFLGCTFYFTRCFTN